MKVSNGKCVRRLGFRAMTASRTRNIVAVLAIALTTVLFTSLFTIAASINYSFQQENFRQAGGDGHGTFKDISREQAELFRDDPLIQASWGRLFVGMSSEAPFQKSHVEISYLEPAGAPHYFCEPVEGRLPTEGTDEAATDTHVLALLGVKPEIGARLTIPVTIDENTRNPQTFTRTFTLSGWWEYDEAVVASHILLPRSAAEALAALSNGEEGTMTGRWNLDVMFKNALNIRENLNAVLESHGCQCMDAGGENYIRVGVNWGYTGERFSSSFDPFTAAAVAVILLLIVFTGYLIIYNVFQISVTNDIRFYGLLKTIGTTGRQLKTIIRQQALLLSLLGIPLGLALGFVIGNRLTPVVMAQLSYKNAFVTFNPWIFIGASVFSLLTVFLSCARPGRIAARVSPVEAVRYTEGGGMQKKAGKRQKLRGADSGASLPRMAWANLGRSRGKTVVTVVSLTLAVVLMNVVFTFANGFDMDKYLSKFVSTDFILGSSDQFVAGRGGFRSADQALPEEAIAAAGAQGGVTEGGRIYGQVQKIQQFMPEDFFKGGGFGYYDEEAIGGMLEAGERSADGRVLSDAQVLGMEDFPLSRLNLIEGDLAPLSDPSQNAIAAVYGTDDHGGLYEGSNWARLGDTVTMRYVTEWMYIDLNTGEEVTADEVDARYARGQEDFAARPKVYEEVEYTVCALVEVPSALGYRYSIVFSSEYVLGAERFRRDSGTDSVMIYVFNTAEEANAGMDAFLADYTETVRPELDYESKRGIAEEFEGFRDMFLTMGGVLAGIIGLVGVLNFINAVLTGILTRKRELAVLQSVGMTGRQLKTMLVFEGLYYTLLAVLLSLILSLALGPLMGSVGSVFWFFTYRFTILPVVIVLPVFLALGALVPLLVYRTVAKHTIVERLREAEG